MVLGICMMPENIVSMADYGRVLLLGKQSRHRIVCCWPKYCNKKRSADCWHPCLPNGTDAKDRLNDFLTARSRSGKKHMPASFALYSELFLNG
jgi:hypothetical protein